MASPDVSDRLAQIVEDNLHLPAEQIGNHGGSAAIRHVDKVDTGHHLEQFTEDMLPAPDAARPHVELTWIGLRKQ
jgi:hypothetical protein